MRALPLDSTQRHTATNTSTHLPFDVETFARVFYPGPALRATGDWEDVDSPRRREPNGCVLHLRHRLGACSEVRR